MSELAGAIPLADRAHVLYRMYDAAGALLYIGITLNIANRLSAHQGEKPWWSDVANIKLEHFADRMAVLTAERTAIMEEAPAYNIHWRRGAPMAGHGITDNVDEARFQVLSMISFTQEDVLGSLQGCRDAEHRAQIVKEAVERLRGFIAALGPVPEAES